MGKVLGESRPFLFSTEKSGNMSMRAANEGILSLLLNANDKTSILLKITNQFIRIIM